ncbi:uncharacterized protein AC631_00404 [Debaryomyces fabryi]|uniref:HECT-type E3 ubiquitin transferase n=1 Tax=Debaryomyces fabryi TaxID=58627 RepID=A0A0V1Q5P0_9ASCO|nr:uncharacterized protein AC631_00404 [Debaryomyces fabryi]KSA03769.1 hypothetical protein AC631_00404 [Debaryomyces fabryi]CUM45287.1 unnamed protein product [Debaryomyces fabryi]
MLRRKSSTSGTLPTSQPKNPDSNSKSEITRSNSQWKLLDRFKPQNPPLKASYTSKISEENSSSIKKEHKEEVCVKNCKCCGTIVSYSGGTHKFRCSVCNTTNVIMDRSRPQPDPSSYPLVLSFKRVKKMIDKCVHDADEACRQGNSKSTHEIFEPLSSYLFLAFKSYPCLNNSFKIKKTSKKIHYSTSNLNLEDIRSMFVLLTHLPTKRPLYNALSGASDLLKRVEVYQNDDARNLLWLLILLEIPFLSNALVNYEKGASTQITSMIDVPEIKTLCYDILKRVFGIMAQFNSTPENNYIASWVSKLNKYEFLSKVDLINLYITFHLKKYFHIANNPHLLRRKSLSSSSRHHDHPTDYEYLDNIQLKNDLEEMPSTDLSSPGLHPAASLIPNRTTLPRSKSKKDSVVKIKIHQYANDWHLKTAAIFLSTFNRANSIRSGSDKLLVSIFYNSLLDFVNIKLDFDSWQSNKKSSIKPTNHLQEPELQTVIDYIHGHTNSFKFNESSSYFFCQYPFLISLGSKISILEYEARRQMERKAEEAFINSLDKRIAIDVYFKVRVRREYIVQDSLRCIKINPTNLKKSLRVQFIDEPGVDAGGIKKEWFLLLTRALFSPQAGIFVNIEDSNLLWFNIVPIENYEMYYLFGAILGLAIYNSTILNLKFPTVLYKLLLGKPVDLSDYQKLYPVSASNLLKLREYNDEELRAMELTFEASYTDLLGKVHTKQLIPKGRHTVVTSQNRETYIEKYAKFFMSDGIANQVNFFVKGFSTVIGGNALSLFLPQEIELLLCGSDEEKIDVAILRSITKYTGWKDNDHAMTSSAVKWFWEYMDSLSYKQHKKVLAFVTGSDRVPATGIQNLNFRISRLANGKDSNRLPVAHTCFNELALYEYSSKEKMISKLTMAVNESSGFGIK